MIRQARLSDIPRIVEMGAKFHAMSDYTFVEYDPVASAAFLEATIQNPDGIVLCHEQGMIGGALVPLYFNPAKRVAVETFWWADANGMALLDHFEWWAEARGAVAVTLSCLGNKRDKALGRVFERRGYSKAETSYMRAI